jgi:MFS family permease
MTTSLNAEKPRSSPTHHFRPGTARAAFSYRSFRVLFIGTALSSVGTWMQNFTLPAYLDGRTSSASLVGLLVFAQLGPLLVLSIPAGVLADRVNRTKLVIAMQTTMLSVSIVLAILVSITAPLWTIFAAQLVLGVAISLNQPAFNASIPMLVDRADIAGAISLNSAMINGSRILGPALAAVLAVVGFSTAQLFIVNAATFLFLIVPLFFVALPTIQGNHPERGWRMLTSGINIVKRRKVLSRVLISMCLFSLFSLPFIGLFPSVARLNFGLDPTASTYKWLYVVWGLGAFFGALGVGTVFASVDKRVMIPTGFALFGISLMAFGLMNNVTPAFPISAVVGFAYFMTTTALITVVQTNITDNERGAVMPLWFMAFAGTIPIGNLIGGPIMDSIGSRPVLIFGGAFALGLAWWSNLTRLPAEAFLSEEEGGEPFRRISDERSS